MYVEMWELEGIVILVLSALAASNGSTWTIPESTIENIGPYG